MPTFVEYLPAVNASLNGAAAVLLVVGYLLIKRRKEAMHKWVMVAAFVVSMLFLAGYLTYHALKTWHTQFTGPSPVRTVYYVILISHVMLAATVPFLAGITLWLGFADRRASHRRWANRTFPIWLYVSITGVLIYAMLYHLYPPEKVVDTIGVAASVTPSVER